jgi:hypothetical protein
VLRLSFFFRSFSVLGAGNVGDLGGFPGAGVESFLVGNVDVGVHFLKWDETEGELC